MSMNSKLKYFQLGGFLCNYFIRKLSIKGNIGNVNHIQLVSTKGLIYKITWVSLIFFQILDTIRFYDI